MNVVNRTTANGLGSNDVRDVYASGNRIYAATPRGLAISIDKGMGFTNTTTIDALGSDVAIYDIHGSEPDRVYVATSRGLAVSYDGGMNFVNKTTADGLGIDRTIGVYGSGNFVYAVTRRLIAAP